MNTLSNFVDTLADYLGNPDRLPFACPKYTVIAPSTLQPKELEFRFQNREEGVFGHLTVNYHETGELYIFSINSDLNRKRLDGPRLGYGREFIRRSVLYAYEQGYDRVTTSIFVGEASSFWLGTGFRSNQSFTPNWEAEKDKPQEIERWKSELEKSPDALWKLARTEFGENVLCNRGWCGILDFNDEIQRQYAFGRLRLSGQGFINAHPA